MKINPKNLIIPFACLALTACDLGKAKEAKAPTGQVVATVDGEEITARELRAELQGMSFPSPQARKSAEQAALQSIIDRKLLAKAAEEAKLDETPDFALQKARVDDLLLAQALVKKTVDELPPPTREEAQSYVTAHPDLFAERKIFDVDQIRTPVPTDAALMAEFKPLKSLEQIEQLLTAKKIPFRRGLARLDAATVDPRLVDAIVKLPPDEVFVMPAGDMLLINHVRAARVEPFTGEPAIKHALQVLKQQRIQETLARQRDGLRKAVAGKVQFSKEYQPPKPSAPPAKAAPKAT